MISSAFFLSAFSDILCNKYHRFGQVVFPGLCKNGSSPDPAAGFLITRTSVRHFPVGDGHIGIPPPQ